MITHRTPIPTRAITQRGEAGLTDEMFICWTVRDAHRRRRAPDGSGGSAWPSRQRSRPSCATSRLAGHPAAPTLSWS